MNPAEASQLKAELLQKARTAGFGTIGITSPEAARDSARHFREFLRLGRQGDMHWLTEKADRRADPLVLWPEVKSLILLGMNYGPDENPLEKLRLHSHGNISCYAHGRDYHDLVKRRLKQVARWLHGETGARVKVFVDTAPVLEKPLAASAGLGWQGKHTNLVSRDYGSWLFLGAIFTELALPFDAPENNHCGSCHACLDICPTRAFPGPYQLDARRCISYLTIEHKGHIAAEFRKPMGNRVYGCDDCLAVCPWNKWAQAARESAFAPSTDIYGNALADLLRLDDAAFRLRFTGSPVKRTGRDRFVRNCLIAAGNSGDASLLDVILPLLRDASPLVRAMAVWSIRQLAPAPRLAAMREPSLAQEGDPEVRAEWDGIMAS